MKFIGFDEETLEKLEEIKTLKLEKIKLVLKDNGMDNQQQDHAMLRIKEIIFGQSLVGK